MKGTYSNAWDNAFDKFTLLSVQAVSSVSVPSVSCPDLSMIRSVPLPSISLTFL